MPLLLRAIRKPRWCKDNKVAWLEEGKAQADALGDLLTQKNQLSVWHVEDDKSNLCQVVAAIAATRDHASNLDYALFDQTLLTRIRARIENTVGHTPHREANARWHRDIVELSAEKIAELANIIMECGTKVRISEPKVISLVKQAVTSGIVDMHKLENSLKRRIV